MTTNHAASSSIVAHARGAVLAVTIVPRASNTVLERLSDGTLRVRLAAPPVDGAANTALLHFIADTLGLPRSRLSIVSGAASRRKRIVVEGNGVDELTAKVRAVLAH